NCGSDSDRRYGRGFQRAHLRAHTRGVAPRQDAVVGSGPGIRPRVADDLRYARNYDRLGGDLVPVRNGAGEGIRRNPQLWSGSQPVHGGVRVARDLRGGSESSSTRRGIEHIRFRINRRDTGTPRKNESDMSEVFAKTLVRREWSKYSWRNSASPCLCGSKGF